MSRCEDFAKHGVRHGTDPKPISGCCQHEGDKQSGMPVLLDSWVTEAKMVPMQRREADMIEEKVTNWGTRFILWQK